jgi:hypothetical protein
MSNEQNMGIKADKAHESPSVSAPKVAPTTGGVTAPGVSLSNSGAPSPTEAHLRTAVQALAYLVAVSSVTKRPSVFDAEREEALACIRDNCKLLAAAPALVEALKCCVDELVVTARIRNVPCRAEELARAAIASVTA